MLPHDYFFGVCLVCGYEYENAETEVTTETEPETETDVSRKDLTVSFASRASSYPEGTALRDTDLADFFVLTPHANQQCVIKKNGISRYNLAPIGEMIANTSENRRYTGLSLRIREVEGLM